MTYIYIYIYIYLLIYLLYFNQFPLPRGRHASCHVMSENRRLVKLKKLKTRNFPLYALKLWAWAQTDFRPSRASYSCCSSQLWHHVEVKSSYSVQRPIHSPSQTLAIHSCRPPLSLLAGHPNPFSSRSPSRYQSISTMAYNLSLPWHTY